MELQKPIERASGTSKSTTTTTLPRKTPAQPQPPPSVSGRPPRFHSTRPDPTTKRPKDSQENASSSSSHRSRTTTPSKPGLARSSTVANHRTRASESSLPSPATNRLRRSNTSLSSSSPRGPQSPRDSNLPRPTPPTPSTAVKAGRPLSSRQSQRPTPKSNGASSKTTAATKSATTTTTTTPTTTPPDNDNMRQPMGMRAAFELAQQQELNGVQSSDDTFDLNQAFQLATAEANGRIDGSPSPAPRSFRSKPEQSQQSPGTFLQRFDNDHKARKNQGPLNGLFGKSRHSVGQPAAPEPTHEQPKPVTQTKSKENIEPVPQHGGPVGGKHDSQLPTPDEPMPSIEFDTAMSQNFESSMLPPVNFSPEKSMNWHLDADFTAGDLQVSNSPRVRSAKSNGYDSRALAESPMPNNSPAPSTPGFRRSNDKLDRLRAREAEVAKLQLSELDPTSVRRTNTKLDEIRARENEAFFSKRAVATSKLDQIRMRNAQARSQSPETPRHVTKTVEHQGSEAHEGNASPAEPRSKSMSPTPEKNAAKSSTNINASFSKNNESILDTDSQDLLRRLARATTASPPPPSVEKRRVEEPSIPKSPVKDTTASEPVPVEPAPVEPKAVESTTRGSTNSAAAIPPFDQNEPVSGGQEVSAGQEPPKPEEPSQHEVQPRRRELSRPRAFREERRSRNFEFKNLRDRPTVGFVGIRRTQSTDSLTDKRISMATSDADPTARIEAEMRLFALRDDYSERGSIRAPSPVTSEPLDEETPRPKRIDPLLMPTPRVTGAWLDTPATVRVKAEESDDKTASDSMLHAPKTTSWFGSLGSLGSRRVGRSTLSREDSSSSEAKGKSKVRSSSAPSAPVPPRARSTSRPRPRRRRHPQVNTAKPPSVKDDLRAILQSNEIEDSTLDNFEHALANHELKPEELEAAVNTTIREFEQNINYPGASEDSLLKLAAYDRMSKQLTRGVTDIRTAKQGIERLEGQVTQIPSEKGVVVKPEPESDHEYNKVERQPETKLKLKPRSKPDAVKDTTTPLQSNGPLVIQLPALYRAKPFQLTKFGLFSLVLAVWLALESVFCFLYAPPQYACLSTGECDWSPNEPYFPYAMPFMLDEWSTGGKGRALMWYMGEEVGDAVADVSDWVTDTDFTRLDQRYMNAWERKRHRRRLRKHGLIPTWVEPPQYQARYAEWQASQMARNPDGDAFGYDDEYMSADETII